MKFSKYFWPILRDLKDEDTILSHKLSIKAGFIKMLVSGLYLWTPPGYRILRKIEEIVRQEMDRAGAQEVLCTCVQPADLWKKSGRYDDYGQEMLRFKDRHEQEMLFGPTHEEVMSFLLKSHVKSYKQLPKNLYQIHWKFRDEIRPRYGLMRAREFLMKDGYSFSIDHQGAVDEYNNMYKAYFKVFKRMGLKAIAVRADTGPIGGDLSHEFQIMTQSGEGTTFFDKKLLEYLEQDSFCPEKARTFYAATDEIHEKNLLESLDIFKEIEVMSTKTVEVGHIFNFDQKYSIPLEVNVQNEKNELISVYMGSYGIGVSRLFAAIIEASHDERGIIWPEAVAPYKYVVIDGLHLADNVIYDKFVSANIDFIYDDTSDTMGEKFNRWDLYGVPYQIILGKKFSETGKMEIKNRANADVKMLDVEEFLKNNCKEMVS